GHHPHQDRQTVLPHLRPLRCHHTVCSCCRPLLHQTCLLSPNVCVHAYPVPVALRLCVLFLLPISARRLLLCSSVARHCSGTILRLFVFLRIGSVFRHPLCSGVRRSRRSPVARSPGLYR